MFCGNVQVVKRPIDLDELRHMINVNEKRFDDVKVNEEWERVHAHHVQLQREQCQQCLTLRDVEQKSGQRKSATPEQNRSARETHRGAIKQLEDHWESGTCKERREVGPGWIFDGLKPFNPADVVMVQVNCRNCQ